jgi:hypothetical protein
VALLAAVSPDVVDRHSVHADPLQGLFDFIQLERLNNGFDLLHVSLSA